MSADDKRYVGEIGIDRRQFKTEAGAKRWVARVAAAFRAANVIADNEIWTSIDIIYLTRWDCSTTRLAAAHMMIGAAQ